MLSLPGLLLAGPWLRTPGGGKGLAGKQHRPLLTGVLFFSQIMSVLLFIEYSVEVAHGKASCKFSQTGYFRIGRSRRQEWGLGKGRGRAPAGGRQSGV